MRLIDADALDWKYIEEEYHTTIDTVRACKSLVLNAPTVDAVPKIQCMDCRFSGKYGGIDLRKINATD